MHSGLNEKILLYRIRTADDREAFAVIYDAYVQPLYRFVYFRLGSREEAEDVTSEIFMKAWQYLRDREREEEIRSLKHLLYGIARNAVVDRYRARARQKQVSLNDAMEIQDTKNIAATFEQDEAVRTLMAQVKKLKQEYQDVIFLRYVEGLSVGDIAAVQGKGTTNVRVLLHRAVKKLRAIAGTNTYE